VYRREEPDGRIPIIGVSGTRERVAAAHDPSTRGSRLNETFAFTTPADGRLGPFQVSYAPMRHRTPTNAIRIEYEDRSLVYSGDTGECADLVGLARGADVFLCEASVGPDEESVPDLHLTGRQAGDHAQRADVDRLIVTHVPPWNSVQAAADEAASTFDGSVELAHPGAQYWF
jgi:ribonuclease BN (tRNA processing enzyme)